MVAGGFDAARSELSEDLLGRAAFAREIASLATSTPEDWSVRIGIYGPWGSGKTTVMNYARSIVETRGAITVNFNPWGFADPPSMFNGFARALADSLSAQPGGTAARKAARKALGSKLVELFSPLQSMHEAGGAVLGFAQRFAARVAPKTAELEAAVKAVEARIVVFIDDIDRADPRTLPDLLYVLKQVLDIGGLSFVLALDPHVVGLALQKHHPGWHDGQRFLEKIIDFPRSLPETTSDQIARLIEAERISTAPWCPHKHIYDARELLPTNPRRARAFLRHLWSIKEEVERYDADELDWPMLVRVNLIRAAFPDLFDLLFGRSTRINEVLRLMTGGYREDDTATALREKELDEVVTRLLTQATVAPDDISHAMALIHSLGDNAGWVTDRASSCARLATNPAVITWKEYRMMRATSDLGHYLEAHAERRSLDREAIVRAAAHRAAQAYSNQLGHAADASTEAATTTALDASEPDLSLLESLLFEHGGVLGPCSLSGSDVVRVMRTLVEFAHFRNLPQHRAQRVKERQLLSRIVFEAETPMLEVLEALKPWETFDDEDPSFKLQTRRISACRRVVTFRAAEELIPDLATPGFVARATRRGKPTVARHLLFAPTSPLWTGRGRRAVLAMLTAPVSAAVASNALDLFRTIADGVQRREFVPGTAPAESVLLDALWAAGTSRAINVRRFQKLEQERTELEKIIGSQLPDPSWWGRLSKESRRSTSRRP